MGCGGRGSLHRAEPICNKCYPCQNGLKSQKIVSDTLLNLRRGEIRSFLNIQQICPSAVFFFFSLALKNSSLLLKTLMTAVTLDDKIPPRGCVCHVETYKQITKWLTVLLACSTLKFGSISECYFNFLYTSNMMKYT